MANFENDFKKIIALSILSQLELIIIILSFGFRLIAYYHLLAFISTYICMQFLKLYYLWLQKLLFI